MKVSGYSVGRDQDTSGYLFSSCEVARAFCWVFKINKSIYKDL